MKQKFGRKLDNNLMWYGTLPCCDVLFIETVKLCEIM